MFILQTKNLIFACYMAIYFFILIVAPCFVNHVLIYELQLYDEKISCKYFVSYTKCLVFTFFRKQRFREIFVLNELQ